MDHFKGNNVDDFLEFLGIVFISEEYIGIEKRYFSVPRMETVQTDDDEEKILFLAFIGLLMDATLGSPIDFLTKDKVGEYIQVLKDFGLAYAKGTPFYEFFWTMSYMDTVDDFDRVAFLELCELLAPKLCQ